MEQLKPNVCPQEATCLARPRKATEPGEEGLLSKP